jgi:opacity protein-like surface antigen
MTLRTRRRALAGVLAAAALAVAAAPAAASSVVYVKDGNVWLTDPAGAKQYQVTFDGGYASPSQASSRTSGRRPTTTA